MTILLFIAFIVIITGGILLFIVSRQKKSFGILVEGNRLYQDSQILPGETLIAKSIPLHGKPDYLVKLGKYVIPVEKKTSKAPTDQYKNNTMQLMAYCLLVEENYGIRPPGGYLKYADKELKIRYTKEAEDAVRYIVKEILDHKRTNKELHCNHPSHYK